MPISNYPITKRSTELYGLVYAPSFADNYLNSKDQLPGKWRPEGLDEDFTSLDQQVLLDVLREVDPAAIFEIGVHRPHKPDQVSSTQVLIKNKSPEAVYIGVDKEPRDITGWGANVFFVQGDSADRQLVAGALAAARVQNLDLIFIDGWHSVNQVLQEWEYVEWLSDRGAVVLHDTNFHPGPILLLDAIDRELFAVTQYGVGEKDWGIAVARRI